MGKTSKSAWTKFERDVASGWGTKRNPLSGANNRQADGSDRPGDAILDGFDALIECKYRAKQAHHSLFRDAQADAVKHGISPEHVFLYTKRKGEHGGLVTMDMDTFHRLVVPKLKPALRKKKQRATMDSQPSPSPRSSVRRRSPSSGAQPGLSSANDGCTPESHAPPNNK